MNRLLLLFISILAFSSCSQKVYFFDAEKQAYEIPLNKDENIEIDAYFAGDALDYVVFELDVKNNGNDSLLFDHKDIFLKIYNDENSKPIVLNALDKNDVINQLYSTKSRLKREKTSRDIGNAIGIGLNLLAIGVGNTYSNLDLLYYSTETAAIMLEDSRSYKLVKGSIEEQIEYVEDWVIYKEKLASKSDESYDVLFERRLFESESDFVLSIFGQEYMVPFLLKTIEEKVR